LHALPQPKCSWYHAHILSLRVSHAQGSESHTHIHSNCSSVSLTEGIWTQGSSGEWARLIATSRNSNDWLYLRTRLQRQSWVHPGHKTQPKSVSLSIRYSLSLPQKARKRGNKANMEDTQSNTTETASDVKPVVSG